MPQIIGLEYFQKANILNIPLSVDLPNPNPAIKSASNTDYLTELCTRIEKSLLLNAFGLATYNTLQLALADIDNPLYASYKKLVQGQEYDGKVWAGLNDDYSFIAAKIYDEFNTETNKRLSAVGVVSAKPEKASLETPMYKIAAANQMFFKNYQGGYLIEPIVIENFTDWYGQNEDVEVSLYQYMVDKKTDFTSFDIEKFRVYTGEKNSFGI